MKINTDTYYFSAIVISASLILILISFFDSSIKLKDSLLISFGLFLSIVAQLIVTYIDHETKDSN